jgi:hypothetical protein
VTLPYFDPQTGTFKTASSGQININVTKGKAGSKPQTRYLTQEEIREVGRDIRYIKTGVKITNQEERPYREPLYFLLLPLPLIIFVLSILYRSRQTESRRMRLSRSDEGQSAWRGKSLLCQKIRSKDVAVGISGKISEVIERFISEKFGFPATGRTLEELKIELLKYCADEKIVSDLASFIETIDSYRFGGKSLDEKTRNELISKTEAFITGLKNTKEKSKVTMTGVVLLLLTGFAFYAMQLRWIIGLRKPTGSMMGSSSTARCTIMRRLWSQE